MMKRLSLLLGGVVLSVVALAQQAMTRQMYIDTYYLIAVREMTQHGIPASITLAQGILESGNGNSRLAVEANNHFGIKCHTGWEGPYIRHDDDEKQECFRKYTSPDESYRDHSLFLTTRSRYAFLFDLKPTNYKAWAKGLKKAGYATSKTYADHLIRLIETHHLYVYDTMDYEELLAEQGADSLLLAVTTPREESEPLALESEKEEAPAVVSNVSGKRRILMHENRIRYMVAQPGDKISDIVKHSDAWDWEIARYNDIEKNHVFEGGEVVFLQPKRRKAKTSFHQVEEGETLVSISQKYGVKVKWILRRNRLEEGYVPMVGDTLWLRGWKRK